MIDSAMGERTAFKEHANSTADGISSAMLGDVPGGVSGNTSSALEVQNAEKSEETARGVHV